MTTVTGISPGSDAITRPATTPAARAAKRAFDVVVAAGLLALLLPIIGAIALLVRADSSGPAFFRCERVGYRGRTLRMLKFRKMVVDATGGPLTVADDERFTRIGRWLTKYKLDELPQLWHVLAGEMSLVGPRPESPEFVARYVTDYYERILTVRPGIFGLSQIAFARENAILDVNDPIADYVERILPQKVALDRMYADCATPWHDINVLFWSAVTVVLRWPVAVHRGSARMRIRRRERACVTTLTAPHGGETHGNDK
jgi:lipopolysaccharide/colanic/teichoic acid biosynthesis glycosyltransferase